MATPPSRPRLLTVGRAAGVAYCQAITRSAHTVRPVLVVVSAMSSTTTRRLVSRVARQFWLMWQNMRCPTLFHFDVPGG